MFRCIPTILPAEMLDQIRNKLCVSVVFARYFTEGVDVVWGILGDFLRGHVNKGGGGGSDGGAHNSVWRKTSCPNFDRFLRYFVSE